MIFSRRLSLSVETLMKEIEKEIPLKKKNHLVIKIELKEKNKKVVPVKNKKAIKSMKKAVANSIAL